MVQLTMVSGLRRAFVKAKVSSFGKMVASMKAIGRTTRPMDKGDSFMQMATVTSESGLMTKLMEEVPMNIWTEPIMLETGKKISSMDTA
jgi:hypothetical protein